MRIASGAVFLVAIIASPVALNAAEEAGTPVSDADREFWAFRPPVRPPLPAVKRAQRVRTPIDAFILAKLEDKGLTLSPEADRRTLIRRASFDLLGLPPTPEEAEAFVNDKEPYAYERLIDRLLASPHYSERWGRHWLDAAGYADSDGYLDADRLRPEAYRYRDYVIRSFNVDKPYDRFVMEQLAGDEMVDLSADALTPEMVVCLVATGFLRTAPDPTYGEYKDTAECYQVLDDTITITTSALLGLTVHCARCHDHKFDPILQRDYYRLQAVFLAAYDPANWVVSAERGIAEGTLVQREHAKRINEQVEKELEKIKKQRAELSAEYAQRLFEQKLARLPEAIREDVRTALKTETAARNEVQKYLAEKFEKELKVEPAELLGAFPEFKAKDGEVDKALKAAEAERIPIPHIRGLADMGSVAPKAYILRRGDHRTPGEQVPPGVLEVLNQRAGGSGQQANGGQQAAGSGQTLWEGELPASVAQRSTGRRTALARWLTGPAHPLTARVMVNRIWQHHFGRGLVATPENFGRTGRPPSHPELLDWLATEFVGRGWSVKAMHKLVMMSSVYRQASLTAPAPPSQGGEIENSGLSTQDSGLSTAASAEVIDPDNVLLWRMPMRRLEAEAIRDSILAVAGTLNRTVYGPPVDVKTTDEGEIVTADEPAAWRRSVYLIQRRSKPLTLLNVFDAPVMETNCTRRGSSTIAPQALQMLNSEFTAQQAEHFAKRVFADKAAADEAGRVTYAFVLAFARPPREGELQAVTEFLKEQTEKYVSESAGPGVGETGKEPDGGQRVQLRAWVDLCHMLLNANEFVYVD